MPDPETIAGGPKPAIKGTSIAAVAERRYGPLVVESVGISPR